MNYMVVSDLYNKYMLNINVTAICIERVFVIQIIVLTFAFQTNKFSALLSHIFAS